jgi:dipeptidyl aminopeptidase/acylaminoacyl peptidase
VERLASGSVEYQAPSSWSPDGKSLAFVVRNAETDKDIWIVPRNGEAEPFLSTRFSEEYPEFSPDGRWLVYTSDESGRDEVYVRPYPGPGRALQISTEGGLSPGWSRDGSELFYRWQEDFFAVPITIDGENLRPGTPLKLFDLHHTAYPVRSWDVGADGRFLVTGEKTDADLDLIRDRFYPDRIHVVLNWFEELKHKAEAAQ